MNAPNRSRDVQTLCAQHPEAFGPPAETNDARRLVLLQTVIIPFLNQIDAGQWGMLVKTNQGGKIPCDIIAWKDTLEIFDVMTGTGASWIPVGRITDPAWQWRAVDVPAPDPGATGSSIPSVSSAPVDLSPILARLAHLEETVNGLANHLTVVDSEAEEALHRPLPRYISKKFGVTIVSYPEGS